MCVCVCVCVCVWVGGWVGCSDLEIDGWMDAFDYIFTTIQGETAYGAEDACIYCVSGK